MGDFCILWADVMPILYHLADVIAFINVIVVGKTLHHLCDLLIADVIAKWQDGTATCYSQVADGITTQSGNSILAITSAIT